MLSVTLLEDEHFTHYDHYCVQSINIEQPSISTVHFINKSKSPGALFSEEIIWHYIQATKVNTLFKVDYQNRYRSTTLIYSHVVLL